MGGFVLLSCFYYFPLVVARCEFFSFSRGLLVLRVLRRRGSVWASDPSTPLRRRANKPELVVVPYGTSIDELKHRKCDILRLNWSTNLLPDKPRDCQEKKSIVHSVFSLSAFIFKISCVYYSGHQNTIHVKLNLDGNQLVPKKILKSQHKNEFNVHHHFCFVFPCCAYLVW